MEELALEEVTDELVLELDLIALLLMELEVLVKLVKLVLDEVLVVVEGFDVLEVALEEFVLGIIGNPYLNHA